jgi:HSF-type DNA-binding
MSATTETDTRKLSFPTKLYNILKASENGHHAEIIGWLPDGDAFKIHSKQSFCDVVMKQYFIQTNFKSFTRQLYLYGFLSKTTSAPHSVIFHHPLFIRSDPVSCTTIKRNQVVGDRRQSKAGHPRRDKTQGKELPSTLSLSQKSSGAGRGFAPPLLPGCDSSWPALWLPQRTVSSVSFASESSSHGQRNVTKTNEYLLSVLDEAFLVMGETDDAAAPTLSHTLPAATLQFFQHHGALSSSPLTIRSFREEDNALKIEPKSSFTDEGFDIHDILTPRPIEEMIRSQPQGSLLLQSRTCGYSDCFDL